jgi:cobalt transporter subunit CbtA
MLRDTFLTATLAGLFAALMLTIVQSAWITPLILEAETYESGSAQAAPEHEHAAHEHAGHDHGDDEWRPADGWQRTGFTFAANLVLGLGYSLVLMGVYLLWRHPSGMLSGAVFGIGGFIVFFGAPALGLPPELPGTASAALSDRQLWWTTIVVATGAGLLLLFARPFTWLKALAGAVLLIAPHLMIAAPEPEAHGALAPDELQQRFQIATTLANAAFWVLLGVASSHAFRKLMSWHGRLGDT